MMKKIMVAITLAFLIMWVETSPASGATERLEEVSSFDFDLGSSDLAWDGENLWATDPNEDKIYKIDTSGNVISSFDSPGVIPYGLAWDGEHLWVTSTTTNKIYKVDTSGNLVSSFVSGSDLPFGLTWDGEHLWVNEERIPTRIIEYDTSGNTISSFNFMGTRGLTWDGEHLWAAEEDHIYLSNIYKFDKTGNVVSSFDPPSSRPRGLAWDGERLWVSDRTERRIYSLKLVTYYELLTSAYPSGGGSVTLNPSGENYENGTEVTATAVPAEGYEFDYWSGDVPSGLENDNTITVTMDSDKSLTAHFAQVVPFYTLNVSVSPPEGGSVTLDPLKGEYMEGTVVTITAVPAENYEFQGWSGDISGSASSINVTMDSDKTIIASFETSEVSGEGLPLAWVGVGVVIVGVIIGILAFRRFG